MSKLTEDIREKAIGYRFIGEFHTKEFIMLLVRALEQQEQEIVDLRRRIKVLENPDG